MDLEELRKQKLKQKKAKATVLSSTGVSDKTNKSENNLDESESLFRQAQCYEFGRDGYSVDKRKAFNLYLQAAEFGHTTAMVEVGGNYAEENYFNLTQNEAEDWGLKAIQSGDPDGYEVLAGVCLVNGDTEGILKNLDLGINQGGLRCIIAKSVVLFHGLDTNDIHIEADEKESYRLLTSVKWTDDNSLPFEYLGHYAKNKEDYFLAKEYYERALKINPSCYSVMSSLGDILRNVDGLIDYPRAHTLLHKAAINGDADGMNSYALMLYFGENGNEDKKTALEWMRRSAELGYTQAMINLGDIYADVHANPIEARVWYQKAAAAGDPQGEERLKNMGACQTSKEDMVQNMFDHYLNDEENILRMSPSATSSLGFPSLMKEIQNVIDNGNLSDFDADRLRILQGFLSLFYFRAHFFDEDFSDKEEDYYAILDKVDDYITSLSKMTDEGGCIYFIANMYSCHRFKGIEPLDKLEDLWGTLSTIEPNENETEFKVAFWYETAKEVYDLMKEMWTPESQISTSSSSSNSHQVGMRINDLCVGCGTCESVCPTDSILPGTVYRIDPETCIECGSCVSVCPVDAIS